MAIAEYVDGVDAHAAEPPIVIDEADGAVLPTRILEELAGEARRLVADDGVQGFPPRAIEHAVSAHVLVRSGQWNEARETVLAARELLPAVTDAVPWLAVQARLELARTLLTLRDADLANELLSEIEDICKRCPELGTLPVEAAALQREIDEFPEVAGAASAGLTPAELRLLPLLASHLSFREIAEQLYVSRNTIKTQAISVYRKLGASSRSEAIAKAHELGLGEHLRVLVSNERGLSP